MCIKSESSFSESLSCEQLVHFAVRGSQCFSRSMPHKSPDENPYGTCDYQHGNDLKLW